MEEEEKNSEIFQLMLENENQLNKGIHTERDRIGKELHDGIINELYGVRLILQGLNDETTPDYIKKRKKYIQKIYDIERQISLMIADLHQDIHLSNAFQHILREFFEAKKEISPQLTITENLSEFNWSIIPNTIKLHIYRVVQETLHNTIKYAHATLYKAIIKRENNVLTLMISDNGIGIKSNRKKGNGIKNIQNRVTKMHGTVQKTSNEGMSYHITIPLMNTHENKKNIND